MGCRRTCVSTARMCWTHWIRCPAISGPYWRWWPWNNPVTRRAPGCSAYRRAPSARACRGDGRRSGGVCRVMMEMWNGAESGMADRGFTQVDYETCVAAYAGRLSPALAEQVQLYLEAHPDVAHRARLDAAHEHALAQSYAGVLQEPVPWRLRIERGTARPRVWLHRTALTFCIVLSAVAGWVLGGMYGVQPRDAAFVSRVVNLSRHHRQGQSMRVTAGLPVGVVPPDLAGTGYTLIRQKVLRTQGHAVAEFVYRGRNRKRVRIFAENIPSNRALGSRVVSENGVTLAHWRKGHTRYALVGDIPDRSLQMLAKSASAGPVARGEKVANMKDRTGKSPGLSADVRKPVHVNRKGLVHPAVDKPGLPGEM